AKALIGDVKERHQVALLDNLGDFAPLLKRGVNTGGIMAAGVQQNNSLPWQRVQAGQHALKIKSVGGGVVVGISVNLKPGTLEQGTMVFPAGVANDNVRVRQQALQKVCAQLQGTRSPQGLCGQYATTGDQR